MLYIIITIIIITIKQYIIIPSHLKDNDQIKEYDQIVMNCIGVSIDREYFDSEICGYGVDKLKVNKYFYYDEVPLQRSIEGTCTIHLLHWNHGPYLCYK
jgi:hypothetical protein